MKARTPEETTAVVPKVLAGLIAAAALAVLVAVLEPEQSDVEGWVGAWGPLLSLVSTIALLVVTAIYAYLTKKMADSARDAAEHSKSAAGASRAAAAATEAGIQVEFSLMPERTTTAGELLHYLQGMADRGRADEAVTTEHVVAGMSLKGVSIRCERATVWVHSCRVETIAMRDAESSSSRESVTITTRAGKDLKPRDSVPRQLHRGEHLRFDYPDEQSAKGLYTIEATVTYSIGSSGEQRSRAVRWQETEPREIRGTVVVRPDRPVGQKD